MSIGMEFEYSFEWNYDFVQKSMDTCLGLYGFV